MYEFTHENDYFKALLYALERVDFRCKSGVCIQVDSIISAEIYDCNKVMFIGSLMKTMWRSWPEYSGYINYPVGHRAGCFYAFHNLSRWDGEYGESRKRLLNFLKETCRIALKMK